MRLLASALCALALTAGRAQPAPTAAPRPAPPPFNPGLPTLFVVGDSTAANNGTPMAVGWGVPFPSFFDLTKINVANRARGGRSSRTYVTEGLWAGVLAEMKPGDIVLLQFGHNDGGAVNDVSRARGSLPGLGKETEAIDNLLTKRHEIVHTFGWYLRTMIAEAKARGARPVVLGLTVRNIWHGDLVERGPGDYSAWSEAVARSEAVPFLDLTDLIADRYEELGPARVREFFPRDHTHTSAAGARLNASLVVADLQGLPGDPLAPYFSAAGRAVPAADTFRSPSRAPIFWAFASRPVMGWNSWDDFATTVTGAEVRAEADAMADRLRAHGWDTLTVDIEWYEAGAGGFDYRPGANLTMDHWGRLQPAPNRFPSAADGAGFTALADYVHARGLKFGLHLLRGIPRQAVERNLPIRGAPYHAADIADRKSVCSWNPDMYGVDLSKPGAQAYYDSVFAQYARWGVDLVKVDDISRPYHAAEIAAIRTAIDRSGRAIVLSLSPGPTPPEEGTAAATHANLWRISDDFWDSWPALVDQFALLDRWTPFRGPGHFPDADMLPLGTIDLGRRRTRFTPDEQRTLLTLWSIARSPLILGADLTRLDAATLALVTNDEVIAVDQASAHNRQLFRRDGLVAWVADVPGSPDRYLAVFNTRDKPASGGTGAVVAVRLADLGCTGAVRPRDLWTHADLGEARGAFAPEIPWHGAGLYRLSPE